MTVVLNSNVISLFVAFETSNVSNHLGIHVLDPVNDFFMAAMNHWPLLWVAEVATSPLNNVTGCWVAVTALWAFKATGSCFKLALVATLKALINAGIGSQVTNMVISPVPYRL